MSLQESLAAESFTTVFKVLDMTGVTGFFFKPEQLFFQKCYKVYRVLVFFIIIIHVGQFYAFDYMMKENPEIFLNTVFFPIIHTSFLVKYACINLGSSRLRGIFVLLNDECFSFTKNKQMNILKKNKHLVQELEKKLMAAASLCGFIFIILFFAQKLRDDSAKVPIYVPFETESWEGYGLAVASIAIPIFWTGFGHLSLDVLLATFYAQSWTQFKLLRDMLEHMCDEDGTGLPAGRHFQYKDYLNENIQKRFVECIRRYEKIVWYTNEVTAVFSKAIVFQFFSTTISICLVVYRLSYTRQSLEAIFLVGLFLLVATQVFLFCVFGSLVKYESNVISRSLYQCDWPSLSPRMRRLLLIAGERWKRPITPRILFILPLSVDTFFAMMRSAYTLFTVLREA